jgi:hypothetical protein
MPASNGIDTDAATASTHAAAPASPSPRRDLGSRELEERLGVRMRRLDVAQPLRRRLAVREVARERDRRVERIAVDQRVEESGELARGHGRAGHDHVERRLDADRARQPLRAARAGQEAELHFRQRDLRVAAGDARVAAERQLEPAAHAGPVDRRDDRLGARLDDPDDGVERRLARRRGRAELAHVGAGREQLARADDHDGAHVRVRVRGVDARDDVAPHAVGEPVDRRVVEADDRHVGGDAHPRIVAPRVDSPAMIRDRETLDLLLASIRRFVRERLVPNESRVAEEDAIPADIVAGMRELGLFGLSLPEAYGGLGLTMEEEVLVAFELARTSPAFRTLIGTNNGIGGQGIVIDGTDAQKSRWLPKLASGEIIGSFALTEPGSGSDAASLATTAVRDGDHYVLNGTKRFITNAPEAGIFTVMARTDPHAKGAGAISAFVVERGTPGLSIGKHDRKMGNRARTRRT